MRRAHILAGLAVVLAAACSRRPPPDPAADRMAPGSAAVVSAAPWPDAGKGPRLQTTLRDVPNLDYFPYVESGSMVRIVADDGPAAVGPGDGRDGAGPVDRRRVAVLVTDGSARDRAGTIARHELRPLEGGPAR